MSEKIKVLDERGVDELIQSIAAKVKTYAPSKDTASGTSDGLLSSDDKRKLDSIEYNANYYTHPDSPVSPGTYGTNSSDLLAPGFGDSFYVNGFVVDNQGHVTSATSHAIRVPNSVATGFASGLMSSVDKKKFDTIEEGAQVNTVTGIKGEAETSYRVGDVNITKEDLGLGNLNNVADENKKVGSAAKLTTAVNIGLSGVTATAQSFDGSKNITIPVTAVPVSIVTGLATVATSGKYSDLSGTPSIPAASTTTPSAPGTASYGSANTWARADHVHPLQTTITGNAASATKATQDGDGAVISSTYLKLAGGTMTGALVAQSNANYSTAQVRNITSGNTSPTGGSYGQIYLMYS